jgi:hypothetical protein
MNINDIEVSDSFKQIFDIPGLAILKKMSSEITDIGEARKAFLSALVYFLPEVSDKAIKLRDQTVNEAFLQNDKMWNIFYENPLAISLGYNILSVLISQSEMSNGFNIHPRQIVSTAVSRNISFLSMVMQRQASSYEELIDSKSIEETKYNSFIERMGTSLDKPIDEVSRGVDNIIEALMSLRERTVEEVHLTIDIGLGTYGLWEAFPILADREDEDYSNRNEIITEHHKNLEDIGKLPMDQLLNEIENAAKHFGRGVAKMKLSSGNEGDLHIVEEEIWHSHKGAPMSNLYGFNWKPEPLDNVTPSNIANVETRIILLPSGVISIQCYGEPILEYFAGGWRYVDPFHKSKTITRTLYSKYRNLRKYISDDFISDPIYKVARLAYQLSYHNHGTTIELKFSKAEYSGEGKLKEIMNLRNNVDKDEEKWRKIDTQDEEDNTIDRNLIGRWVYQLSTSDGIITLHTNESQNLYLGDFGQIVEFDATKCENSWNEFLKREIGELKPMPKLGGARHHSAYQRAIDENKENEIKNIVFCVSQDGYIDVYTKNDWLKLR